MNKFLASFQSFVHSVTTNDRYASYESDHRTSRNTRGGGGGGLASLNEDSSYSPSHGLNADPEGFSNVGMAGGRNASATSLDRLQNNGTNPYSASSPRPGSSTNLASSSQTSLNRVQYQPGMRSTQLGNGGIPLQDYADGAPPPPAPSLAWKRIDRWIDTNYPELYDQLSWGATAADLNELESDLDCTLPLDVRDSLMVHDGQESGGRPTGIIFSITLLDLEGISEEWNHWKNTAVRINRAMRQQEQNRRVPSSSQASTSQPPTQAAAPRRQSAQPPRLNWLDHQESVPEGAIQRVYAHPGWIPLAKDGEGNNIGIDLAPGPRGRWGQVILFGRDFDKKYVVANCWANFLTTFADDLENGDHYVFDDVEEGELRFRAPNRRLVSYFDVLKSRVDRQVRQLRKQAQPNTATHTQRSPAANSRIASQNSASSTRNSSPSNVRNLSGQKPEGSLISPMGSSTNLPAARLSTSNSNNGGNSAAASANNSTVASPVEDKASINKTESKNDDDDDDEQEAEEKTTSEPAKEKKNGKEKVDDNQDLDEVDMLKDELTEVEI